MRLISKQFYDDDDEGGDDSSDDDGSDDEDPDPPSENETREAECKVSVTPRSLHKQYLTHTPSQRLQIETTKLKAENKALKSKSNIRQGHTAISSASSAVSDAATNPEEKARLAEFRGLGKRVAILSEIWLRRSLLRQPCPTDLQSLGPWHLGRCENAAAWDDGIVAELYHFLPSPFHEALENSALFSEQVCQLFSEHYLRLTFPSS
jgi:hypothetical protein